MITWQLQRHQKQVLVSGQFICTLPVNGIVSDRTICLVNIAEGARTAASKLALFTLHCDHATLTEPIVSRYCYCGNIVQCLCLTSYFASRGNCGRPGCAYSAWLCKKRAKLDANGRPGHRVAPSLLPNESCTYNYSCG